MYISMKSELRMESGLKSRYFNMRFEFLKQLSKYLCKLFSRLYCNNRSILWLFFFIGDLLLGLVHEMNFSIVNSVYVNQHGLCDMEPSAGFL